MRKEFILMKCIYCNCENDLTVSDIIPYAMTGAKVKKSFVCKTHNGFTNDNYEKKMISEFAFFRNRLGLTERDGDPVRYNAELNIGEYKFDNVSISDHTSILGSSKRIFPTTDKNGNKVLVANPETLLKQKGFSADKLNILDASEVSIIARSNIHTLFCSNEMLHTVAKIAYEWHCFINDIEHFDETQYQDIVSYILNPDSTDHFVEIVLSPQTWGLMDHISRTGSHMLFEYCDIDGNTYVIYGFWGIIIYKIRICKSATKNLSIANVYNVYSYHVDGSNKGDMFGTYGIPSIPSLDCSSALSILCDEIKNRLSNVGERDLTKEYLINRIKEIKPIFSKYKNGFYNLAQLFDYEHEDRIIPVFILEQLFLNKELFDPSLSFTQNMQKALDCREKFVFTEEKLKTVLSRYVEMDAENTFETMLDSAINYFESTLAF
ncbi:MAG: hypothetical protein IJ292_05775 [Clostridia bacterium]|nr:hypothetical protein [Clostridia bacterium]